MTVQNASLESWLEVLASKEPAPGGGAASALCGALGAALVSMVAHFTMGRPKFASFEEQVTTILQKSEDLRKELTKLIEDDETAYRAVVNAYKMKKATGEEQEKRDKAIHEALQQATEVPLHIAANALEVARVSLEIAQIGNPSVITDAGAAALFARASAEAAILNVIVNLKVLKLSQTNNAVYDRIQEIQQSMGMIIEKTLALMPSTPDEK